MTMLQIINKNKYHPTTM